MTRRSCIAAAALLLTACRAETGAPDISVADGWTREIAPGQSSAAAYATIANRGTGGDRLLGATGPFATATLHSSSSQGGIARMRPIEGGVEIAPNETVELKPGGDHIMLTGLKQPLRAGGSIEVTLRFKRSADRRIAIKVLSAAAAGHDAHGMGM